MKPFVYMHDALVKLRNEGPITPRLGICHNLAELTGKTLQAYDCIDYFGPKWEFYSGEHGYPIPGVDGMNPIETYNKHKYGVGVMWDGEYGELRKKFLDFLIEQCKP